MGFILRDVFSISPPPPLFVTYFTLFASLMKNSRFCRPAGLIFARHNLRPSLRAAYYPDSLGRLERVEIISTEILSSDRFIIRQFNPPGTED